jgi:hypothetical protein
MIIRRSFSVLAATVFALSISQAIASSDAPESQSGAYSPGPVGVVAVKPASAGKTITSPKHSSIATKFLGVITGIVVGTPICMVRKPVDEDKYAVADLTGNSNKGRAVAPTATLWAPFAAVQGILEAPFWAVNNSLVNYNKPFSKDQFSLVKADVSVKKEEEKEKLDPIPYNVR